MRESLILQAQEKKGQTRKGVIRTEGILLLPTTELGTRGRGARASRAALTQQAEANALDQTRNFVRNWMD
jgi:hypothetical protein